jgi:hypothetical protein
MLVMASTEFVRIFGSLLRRADGELARAAACNAAGMVSERDVAQLEARRTMRDFNRLTRGPEQVVTTAATESLI